MRQLSRHSPVRRLADGSLEVAENLRQYTKFYGQDRRVVVTGLGLVTPLGFGVAETWSRLVDGHSAVRKLLESDLPKEHQAILDQLPCKVAACVPGSDADDPQRWKPALSGLLGTRHISFGLQAAEEALHDAAWHPQDREAQERTGVAVGVGMPSPAEMGAAGHLIAQGKLRRLSPYFIPRVLVNMAAGAISMQWSLRGPCHTASTACATGIHSLGDAFHMIKRGDADVMVAGGVESAIDGVSLGGFCRLRALATKWNNDPTSASRPFDAARAGFVMGEGAGVVVLEELQHALNRTAPNIHAEVLGFGMSSDGLHLTQPGEDGRGPARCMTHALQQGGLAPEDVAYINAHATSTPLGDAAEQHGIAAAFGSHATDGDLLVSSTKGAIGHLLGAAGAVEAIFTILALENKVVPPTLNLSHADPSLLKGLVGPLAHQFESAQHLPASALCNSFGFGGTNASLLVRESVTSA
ncbi:hypothetical protein WJX74_001439 [Apatococcus lobatus]|uniref:beta-ketoacyl-[acyl-carrier-protein] synthase I n=2 Tax=Apatococcus TaxID=904362 RepID=A0AAW1T420_9CHLO